MPTLHCPACLRRWREGGPYACDCLDTAEAPANDPAPQDTPEVELASISCLLAVLLIGGWVIGVGVRGLLRLVGLWP